MCCVRYNFFYKTERTLTSGQKEVVKVKPMENGYLEHPGWPTMNYARTLIEPINCIEDLIPIFKGHLNAWHAIVETDIKEARARALCLPETLLMYPNLWIHVINGENFEKAILNKFNEHEHLGEYVKYLETIFTARRVAIQAFKQEIAHTVVQKKLSGQQKYITHIFSNTVNIDCAGVIASFI